MADWSKFSDIELDAIKHKMNQKFEKAMIIIMIVSPVICLIMPYIPGRRGRGPMIDKMPYSDAVLQASIIWFLALIGVWIWNYFKTQNQFSKNRKFLKKKNIEGLIVDKSKGFMDSFKIEITTNLEHGLNSFKIEKEEFRKFNVGDYISIDFEEHTKTIFKVYKIDKLED